jgi:cell division protein FtsB
MRNAGGMHTVMNRMRTIEEIHQEIERLSEERTELWHRLADKHGSDVRAEIRALDARLDGLWQEQRTLRAELRFGDREKIVARARVEERLERAA